MKGCLNGIVEGEGNVCKDEHIYTQQHWMALSQRPIKVRVITSTSHCGPSSWLLKY